MTEDLAPTLIEKVREEFLTRIQRDGELASKMAAIAGGSVSYTDAMDYADCVGRALSEALSAVLTGGALPDGTLYYNIAKRLLEDVGGNAYDLAAQAAERVQEAINSAAGIGLKPIAPDTKSERLTDLINTVSGHPVDEVSSKLLAGARALPQGAVSDTMEANAEFQGKAGIKAKIVRQAEHGCCRWCSSVAGSYSYPDVPKDVYRRHDNCRCKVEYVPSKRERQTVHSGQEGRRRYVQDKYGNYELSKEARISRAKEMEATEAERKAAAREKRIATWGKKKQDGWTKSNSSGKIATKYAPSPQRQKRGIQVSHKKYAQLTGILNTRYPGLTPEDGDKRIYDSNYCYIVEADGYGGLVIKRRIKIT